MMFFPGTAIGTVGDKCEVHVLVKGLVDPVLEINRYVHYSRIFYVDRRTF